jgi:type I restriction enzyme S subunit
MSRIAANNAESRWLAAIHDALLPRLISGELRIGEAERMAEETVPG